MALSRDDILKVDDLKREEVQTPDWGGSVFVRTMTGDEADELFRMARKESGKKLADDEAFVVRLGAACMCDESGERLFSADDVAELGKKNWRTLQIVFDKGCELNGIGKEAVAEMGKPSETTTANDSGSL